MAGVEVTNKRREGQRCGLAFTAHRPFAKLRTHEVAATLLGHLPAACREAGLYTRLEM